MSGLILYTIEDGTSRIQLRADDQTVWLTQLKVAELLTATRQNIGGQRKLQAAGAADEVELTELENKIKRRPKL